MAVAVGGLSCMNVLAFVFTVPVKLVIEVFILVTSLSFAVI